MSVRVISLQDAGNGWLSAVIDLPDGTRRNAEVIPTESEHDLSRASEFPEQYCDNIIAAVVDKARQEKLI